MFVEFLFANDGITWEISKGHSDGKVCFRKVRVDPVKPGRPGDDCWVSGLEIVGVTWLADFTETKFFQKLAVIWPGAVIVVAGGVLL